MSELSEMMAVMVERFEQLTGRFNKFEEWINRFDAASRESELKRAKEQAQIEAKADAAHRRIDELAKAHENNEIAISKINDMMPKLVVAYTIMVFIGGGIGLSLIGLIVSLITGQAHITFGDPSIHP